MDKQCRAISLGWALLPALWLRSGGFQLSSESRHCSYNGRYAAYKKSPRANRLIWFLPTRKANAEKRLQIDALLITEKAVCIIDLKIFGGKITLPKNAKSEFDFGKWTNEKGEIIKGGSSINPFIQLKKILR